MSKNYYFSIHWLLHNNILNIIELTIGSLVRGGLQQGRSVIYFVPFPSNGLTIRLEAITGTVRCYASDTSQRPDSLDYVWTLLITDYDDAFIDPSTLGRTRGSTLYITLEGMATNNNYTLNTTYGDTSITGKYETVEILNIDNMCVKCCIALS